jgi:hypothetical protein
MTGVAKPTPIEAFELNVANARWLIRTAQVLQNRRARKMRDELRSRIGTALRIAVRDQGQLDCFESAELFVVIKPGASIDRQHVAMLDPLLWQAVVAACAALETYVADAVCARVGAQIRQRGDLPSRLGGLPMTVADWKSIDESYQRRRRGLREKVLVPKIRETASTASNQIGILLAMLGVENWARKADAFRSVRRGETVRHLEELTARRNRIAHEGDRRGYGRSRITVDEATGYVEVVEDVARAIESVLAPVAAGGAE